MQPYKSLTVMVIGSAVLAVPMVGQAMALIDSFDSAQSLLTDRLAGDGIGAASEVSLPLDSVSHSSMNTLSLATARSLINATGLGREALDRAGIGFLLSTTSDLELTIACEAYTDAGN
jgi:hypothetical protein